MDDGVRPDEEDAVEGRDESEGREMEGRMNPESRESLSGLLARLLARLPFALALPVPVALPITFLAPALPRLINNSESINAALR